MCNVHEKLWNRANLSLATTKAAYPKQRKGKINSALKISKNPLENTWKYMRKVPIWIKFQADPNTQLVITCSKLTIETLQQGVKYVKSYQ